MTLPRHIPSDLAHAPCPAASEKFDRELGEFVVEGKCPRCGRVMERGHRQHLQSCTGKPRAGAAAPRPYDAALEVRRRATTRVCACTSCMLSLEGS